jgi:NAD(P)-dependent dehydrogenase (short-subunit alcohol dehydrogenase family)
MVMTPEKVRDAAAALDGAPSCVVDLAEVDAADRVVEAALAAHGRLDALVNNAGIFPRADLETSDAAFFDRMFAVNARAPLLLAKRAVRHSASSIGRQHREHRLRQRLLRTAGPPCLFDV